MVQGTRHKRGPGRPRAGQSVQCGRGGGGKRTGLRRRRGVPEWHGMTSAVARQPSERYDRVPPPVPLSPRPRLPCPTSPVSLFPPRAPDLPSSVPPVSPPPGSVLPWAGRGRRSSVKVSLIARHACGLPVWGIAALGYWETSSRPCRGLVTWCNNRRCKCPLRPSAPLLPAP